MPRLFYVHNSVTINNYTFQFSFAFGDMTAVGGAGDRLTSSDPSTRGNLIFKTT